MQNSPQISIIMPVKNEARFLESAIISIQKQSFTDWELIVINDGSTDNTPDILSKFENGDKRIRVISQPAQGLVFSLNRGVSECRSKIIARMDGDDISHRYRLQKQINYLKENENVDLVACGFKHFPQVDIKQGMLEYEIWQNGLNDHESIIRDLLIESPFVHPSVMIRREAIELVGGYRECGWPEDYDLWLRLAAADAKFARLPETLFFWRDHPERATRTMKEYSQNQFRRCKLDYIRYEYLKESTDVIIAGAGKEGRAWQRLLKEAGINVSAWIDIDPKKCGKILHGAKIYTTKESSTFDKKLLIAIGVRAGREQYRKFLENKGLREKYDFRTVS